MAVLYLKVLYVVGLRVSESVLAAIYPVYSSASYSCNDTVDISIFIKCRFYNTAVVDYACDRLDNINSSA
jgi:hypothetical protein